MTSRQGQHLVGLGVFDAHDTPVGRVRDVLVDAISGTPAWLMVGGRNGRAHVVPLARVWLRENRVVLSVGSADLAAAPSLPLDADVDHRTERRLMTYWSTVRTQHPQT